MKIFISWSGPRSRETAEFLKEWLGNVFQNLEIFFSGDIEKGKGWHSNILGELELCDIGIFLLTRQNIDSQWLNYEAGAISKKFKDSNLFTLLLDENIATTELGPLSHFQATKMNQKDLEKLLIALNNRLASKGIKEDRFKRIIEKWAPDLWKKWDELRHIPLELPYKDNRSADEKLDYIMERVDNINANNSSIINHLNRITDVYNTKFDEKLPKIVPRTHGGTRKAGTMIIATTILPDGSKMRTGSLPNGGEFNTWVGYGIATNASDEKLDKFRKKDDEDKKKG